MTQDNPKTNLKQYEPTPDDETAFKRLAKEHRNFEGNDIDFIKSQDDLKKRKRATFEYAMERLAASAGHARVRQ